MRLAALLALLATTLPLFAQGDGEYLYSLSERGRLYVNATLLEKLPGKFKPSDTEDPSGMDRWDAMQVLGADRFVMRVDGRLERNGETLNNFPVPFSTFPLYWVALDVTDEGVFALRTDGMLARDGVLEGPSPDGNTFFFDLAETGGEVFTLRFDGAVFVDAGDDPVFQLRGSPPVDPKAVDPVIPENDGALLGNRWVRIVRDPTDATLVAMREDGVLFRLDPADGDTEEPPNGTELVRFPAHIPGQHASGRYTDLEVGVDGQLHVLRGNGEVYTGADDENPQVDYPPNKTSTTQRFRDLAVMGEKTWVLRGDGRIFLGDDLEELVNIPKTSHFALAISDVAPNFDEFKDQRPQLSRYRVLAVEGADLEIPVLVTDIDEPDNAGLVLSFVPGKKTPEGMSFDPETAMVSWSDVGPKGRYSFRVDVFETDTGKTRKGRFSVKVYAPDENPEKNKAPLRGKVTRLQALVGKELVVPIFVDDRDPADVLTVTPFKPEKGPFSFGATFDGGTNTVLWTPTFKDLGKHSISLLVSDGTKARKIKLRVTVVNPLPISAD